MVDEPLRESSPGFSISLWTGCGKAAQLEATTCGLERFPISPNAHSVKASCEEWLGCVRRGDLCVQKPAVAPGAAVGRKFQIAVQHFFQTAVGIRFPDRAAPTLGTFMKFGLGPESNSQSHTPHFIVRDRASDPLLPASNANG